MGPTDRGKSGSYDACEISRAHDVGAAKPQPGGGEGRRELVEGSNGEAPARSGAGGGGADFSGEQPGRRLPHAHLQLPQPDSRFDSLF
jgi:hypothetical protein